MENTQMRSKRISSLDRGNVKGVGFLEGTGLKIIGYIDGKRGLPRESVTGEWVSPHLDRELRSFDEFNSRIWGRLQIEEEASYAHLGEQMDSINRNKKLLEEAKKDLEEAKKKEKTNDTSRKRGESRLTEAQIIERRARESEKRLVAYKNRVSSLENKITSEIEEFSALRNRVVEDNNSTRMICNRVKDHLFQRIDVYWNSALRKHPENKRMPIIPSIICASIAEEAYMDSHRHLMKDADLLYQRALEEEVA
jgi:hypothetical protein